MYTRKINFLWVANLILFVGVVFLGIEQAGRGAEISKLENELEVTTVYKRDLSENIFELGSENSFNNIASESGFIKPITIVYFDSIDTALGLK